MHRINAGRSEPRWGTPSGVSAIHPGDVVEVEIEGIGVLRNPVVADPAS
jgi:2-keto-4-pentenoate hydratase/2-oxohepta-3-ene-1,7-dioic acid hydratase in catechol pathway